MPSIPLFNYQPAATPQANVRAPGDMFAGVAAAGRNLGAGIGAIGEGVARVAEFEAKKQEAVNYGLLTDAERKMKEGFMLFQDELAANGDETTWVPSWQKRAGQIEQELKLDKLPAAVRMKLEPGLKDWRTFSQAQVQQQATARGIDRSKTNVMASAELDLKMGDVAGYVTKIRGGEARGLFNPGEAQKLVDAGETNAEYYQATNLILSDPIVAMETLTAKNDAGNWSNFEKLDPTRRKTLVDSANVAMQRVRAETYQGLIDRMNGGEVIGDAELDGLVARKLFTPTQARDVKRNQAKGGVAAGQSARFAEVLVAINGYNPKEDGDQKRYADLAVAVATLPPGLKEDAYSQLKDKRDPGSPLNTQVARDAMGQVSDAFSAGLYGTFKTKVINPATGQPEDKVDPVAYARALEKRVKIEDGLTKFFRDNPKATRMDALRYVSDLNAEDVARQGAAMFGAPEAVRQTQVPGASEVDAILEKHGYKTPAK